MIFSFCKIFFWNFSQLNSTDGTQINTKYMFSVGCDQGMILKTIILFKFLKLVF